MKKFIRSKNILSIILCLIIASAMLPTGVMTASAEAAKTYHVSSDTELDAAVAEINSMDSGTYDIYIDSDFTKNGGFYINKAVTVNIFGENHTLSLTGQQSLQAWNGATLNLGAADYKKTFTVKGNDVIDNDNPPEWDNDQQLTDAFMAVSDLYDTFFIDTPHEFRYIGCPDEETRKRLKDLIDKAVAYIIEKNNGKYEIQNDISYDF